jgi:hypothetical protein
VITFTTPALHQQHKVNTKTYTTWLRTAAVFQFVTALIHASTLFLSLPPHNDTEKQLLELMDTY